MISTTAISFSKRTIDHAVMLNCLSEIETGDSESMQVLYSQASAEFGDLINLEVFDSNDAHALSLLALANSSFGDDADERSTRSIETESFAAVLRSIDVDHDVDFDLMFAQISSEDDLEADEELMKLSLLASKKDYFTDDVAKWANQLARSVFADPSARN